MEELWRDVKDYEGLYMVSNTGRIKSLNYRKTEKIVLWVHKDKASLEVNGKYDKSLSNFYVTKAGELYASKIFLRDSILIGQKEGYSRGYLRQYHKINKVVVIGNSITMHGRREADGIEWMVKW